MTESWITRAKEAARRPPPEGRHRGKFIPDLIDGGNLHDIRQRMAIIDSVIETAERVMNEFGVPRIKRKQGRA